MHIKYVSAPCGSGKTHQLISKACEMASDGSRVLFVQPTIELIKGATDELEPTRPSTVQIHGGTVDGSVAAELQAYFTGADNAGHIVFATHQVLPHISFWANKRSWDVIVDEELQVHKHDAPQVPRTHHLLTDHTSLRTSTPSTAA